MASAVAGLAGDKAVGERGESVRLPKDVMQSARVVASLRGEPIQDLLATILRPRLQEMELEALQRRLEGRPQVRRRKPSSGAGEGPEPQQVGGE